MAEPQVHFELFVRRTAVASWTLELATESRTQAAQTAERMLSEKRVVAVKMVKETLDPETGEYRSVTLLTEGELSVAKPKTLRAEADPAPLCTGPADLYTVYARERIGRLLDAWLRRKLVTPFELLHRPDLAESLDASGMELQHAIQKIAIPEAQARGATTHEIIRAYQKLADQTVARLVNDGRRKAFPDAAGAGFAAAATRLAGQPDAAYRLGGAVASQLKGASSWGEKIERILDLADAAPAGGPSRALAFAVLSQPLSEVVGLKGGLVDFIGADQDLGASLALLTRLVASGEIAALVRIEPALEGQFPPLTPIIARLARWLQAEAFAPVQATLARRILAELNGPRRLRPADARGEIHILRALAMVLTAFAGRVLAAQDVHEAFTERSRALVGADFVQAYLQGADTALAEVQALLRLSENLVGGANKRAAVKWITAAVGAPRLERELRERGESPAQRLAALAELQSSLARIGLPEAEHARVFTRIGEIGALVESDCKFVSALAALPAPTAHRIAALLRLASGEAAPLGPATERARAEVQRLLRAPDVRAQLAGSPELVERIKDMLQAA